MEYSTPPTISGHHEAVEGRVRAAALGRSSPSILVGQTASSHPVTFPNEIFDIVFSNVGDNLTLYSLGRCCRAFALLAEPRLYSSLKFTPGSKTIKQARTLVQNPRKSTYVTTIVAELLDVEYILLPAGLKLVITAIVGCPNLRSLSTSWRTEHNWSTGSLLSTRFRLYDFTTWFQWDHRVRQFLETQPSIQELKIVRPGPDYAWGGSPEPDLPPPALPLLSNLEARLPQALAIVPGRPVSSLSLYGAVTLTNLEAALPSFAQSTVPLESLSLQAGELSSDLLTLINAYLPSISRFELRIVRFSMVAYSDLTSESLRQAMGLMSHLCYFRLRLRCPYLFKDPFYHTQRDVILEWKYHCPSLRKVVFESSSENKTPEWTFDEEAMDWMCSLDE